MRSIKQKFLFGLACMLFLSMASFAQYSQGDTIIIPSDRDFSIKMEAEWFDADSSYKPSDLSVPTISEENGISYVNVMPSDMILVYNVDVQGKGGTYKYIFRYRNVKPSGNIRIWIDGDYSIPGFENRGAVQRSLPADITGEWEDFTHSVSFDLTPGKHQIGIQVNKSGCYELDYITVVPVSLVELGQKATINVTANDGMVAMSPDYDTNYVVGDVVEFTATANDKYYFNRWTGDTVTTVNPLSLVLDTTNNITAKIFRIADTAQILSDRYAPVIIEAETATLFWHRDSTNLDSRIEIGETNHFPRVMRDGKEVFEKMPHGYRVFYPVMVHGDGGTFKLSYSYFRQNTGGNRPGNYLFIDDVAINDGAVLETTGPENVYATSANSTSFQLTPGLHWITLKPNGGSGRFDLDRIILTPDSLTATEAQVHVTAELGGTVTKEPDYDIHYVVGDSLTLTATPDFGFLFGGWTGDAVSSDNPLKLKVDSGMDIMATFIDDPDISNYTVTVNPKDSGMVTITPELEDYATGADIEITATPKFGYYFSGWSGDTISTVNPLLIDSITKDYVLDANFEALPTYTLTIQDEYNLTTRSLELDAYPEGTVVNLTADQNRTHRFAYWNEDMALSNKMLEVIITSDTIVKVNYAAKASSMPGDIIYIDADAYVTDTVQAEWYDPELSAEKLTGPYKDQELVIDTIPGTDTIFVTKMGNYVNMGFTLEVGSEGGLFTINYHYKRNSTDQTRVRFSIDNKRIDGGGNNGDWTMKDLPAGEAGIWTSFEFPDKMKLTPGRRLLMFSANFSDRHDCDFFTLTPVPGEIAVDGGLYIEADATKGKVTRSVDKLIYDDGEEVVLTAEPDSGFAFVGWTGDHVGTENPLTVKMDSSVYLTATFVPAFTVSISAASVNGTVNFNPMKTIYPVGDTVRFTPVADAGYKFDGWFADGGIGGSDIPLVLVVNRDIELTAFFSIVTYRLAATAETGGSVSKSPSKISYNAGADVTLTATANEGYVFDGWTGDATGMDNPLSIKMDSMITISAKFKSTVGLDENSLVSFKVYPNPSKGMFTVNIDKPATFEVYSLSGVLVKQGNENGTFNLDMSEFTKGMYAIRIKTQDGVAVQRIVIE